MQVGRVFFKQPAAVCVEKLKGATVAPQTITQPHAFMSPALRERRELHAAARNAAKERGEITNTTPRLSLQAPRSSAALRRL
jgi:hypothetical protein